MNVQWQEMTDTERTVLITGATDGLGKAMALLLAERGYHVFAAGRSAEKRAELDRVAAQKRLPLETLELDVTDDASVQRAANAVLQKFGHIDVLINNAGVAYVGTVEDLSIEDWHRQFDTNFFGVVRVTQAVLPHMRERKKGRIVLISSVAGLVTAPAQGGYSASKHALEALGNALRLELQPFGIHTVLIEPGFIMTGIQQAAQDLAKPYAENISSGPYAKLYAAFLSSAKTASETSKTTPEDCARIVLQAIEAPTPKPRYGITPTATLVKWCKRLLTDSFMDRMTLHRFSGADH
jgi:NAD(P)-dependent dehydrogenase (short-subunit alcohol dehydrogenase family)